MRIVSVVGTRPQLIKAAALLPAIRARHVEAFVDTGQHWDEAMAGAFFAELGLPRPDHSLGLGGGGQAEQTARMLVAIEAILAADPPDAVLVYGDTNSTLAGALAAAKLGIPIAHVEAGLRSFDRTMPEEVNRVVADHLATWLFAPTPTAVANLADEGLARGTRLVGDVLQDLASRTLEDIRDPAILASIPGIEGDDLRPGRYIVATVHRVANRDADALRTWADLLTGVASPDRPVVLPLHPGTKAALRDAGVGVGTDVRAIAPVGYRSALALQLHAAAVLTDSGGVQRESAWLGVPCLVLRPTTEWHEAVRGSGGAMVVIGLDAERAHAELERLAPAGSAEAAARARAAGVVLPPAGAAEAIVESLDAVP